ncbi:MAG: PstS family phosphate ABC transporter substrate-binding protein [Flavisolibacter sp.]
MKVRLVGAWVLVLALFASGCHSGVNGNSQPSAWDSGTVHISCDESFRPVIDKEVEVFESQNPGVRIMVHYKPEAECLRDFAVDTISMVIATRSYSAAEGKFMADSLSVAPESLVVAHDLIAVIVYPGSKDTFFSMSEIRNLLSAKTKGNLIPVFDGTRATSTVRYMLDSVLRGQKLGVNVFAAQSSLGVIDYVSQTPNAVGFVGFSWIGNQDDTAQRSSLRKVRTAWVESTDSAGSYIQPSQYFIYTRTYPMVRDLVYILKEKKPGPARRFSRFLAAMQGQLIFRRAYLMPVILPNYVRDARLQDTINKY